MDGGHQDEVNPCHEQITKASVGAQIADDILRDGLSQNCRGGSGKCGLQHAASGCGSRRGVSLRQLLQPAFDLLESAGGYSLRCRVGRCGGIAPDERDHLAGGAQQSSWLQIGEMPGHPGFAHFAGECEPRSESAPKEKHGSGQDHMASREPLASGAGDGRSELCEQGLAVLSQRMILEVHACCLVVYSARLEMSLASGAA